MILSVLLFAMGLHLGYTRSSIRLPVSEELDNEVSSNPAANLDFVNEKEWVKISQPPVIGFMKKVGDHVEFHCEAMGSPPPTIQWYKRNMRITENESFDTNLISDGSMGIARVASRLVINYILPLHQDVYRCVAESGRKTASAATKLVVKNKEGNEMNFTQLVQSRILGAPHLPRVTFWAVTYLDVIGSDVILPCKSVGNPKPNLVWTGPNDKPIENDDRFSVLPDGELRIRSINWNDMGVYTCNIVNSVGQDSISSFLYPMEGSSK